MGSERSTTAPDGVPLAFEAEGSGSPAIAFVHGWSCDRSYWRHQLAHFASSHLVVALDLGGHGGSGTGRTAWTMESFGGDVEAVTVGLDLDDVVLVGHSMGGDVVTDAALRLGDRVRGVVWVDTYGSLGQPRSAGQVEAVLAPLRADFVAGARALVRTMFTADSHPELVEWVVDDMSSAPPHIAVAALEPAITVEPAVVRALPQIDAPVVQISPRADVAALERHGVRTVLMPRVGHFPMLEAPETFNGILSEIVASFPRRSS